MLWAEHRACLRNQGRHNGTLVAAADYAAGHFRTEVKLMESRCVFRGMLVMVGLVSYRNTMRGDTLRPVAAESPTLTQE
jgi:hypothetical protein